ncbi:dipicolinate synthase subunit DpsA [Anaerocolumna sedimenticola]|uniref:Dipicolinate synthase subunit DpsA n=1 Tax=Anaerocolumna sedimenticola TaxID=2696063 RepID=A0A6P1TPL2_9FIRM|nr:dipicolinate synthase subunit DpsA [Anaerocolumna sedimenticola]QHQ62139.1 dipicolinate synthase subunit DpsA [Anaerocolumna sedimenticola]
MNPTNYDFAIIGGDMRQIFMANDLIARNYSVIVYGLTDPSLDLSCTTADSLAEAIDSSQIIITPIPVSKDGRNIIAQTAQPDLTITQLCALLSSGQKLYGGCLTKEMKKQCDNLGIYYHDFMEQEEVILFNTIATAEGTIAEAILSSTTNLHGSSCLILGFGRCARTLAEKLKGLCGNIDIAARSHLALAAANAASFGTVALSALEEKIDQYDYIFNTIPSLIVTRELLIKTNPDVVIIDISSAPGGIDFPSAKELSRNAKLCLGLPGKYAPKSSAAFLTNYLLTNLERSDSYVFA